DRTHPCRTAGTLRGTTVRFRYRAPAPRFRCAPPGGCAQAVPPGEATAAVPGPSANTKSPQWQPPGRRGRWRKTADGLTATAVAAPGNVRPWRPWPVNRLLLEPVRQP